MTTHHPDADDWVGAVLAFWFDELRPQAWFKPGPEVDATIVARFAATYDACAQTPPETAASNADRALATIIVLDQFPRNMFRGTPKAFATDGKALAIARIAVARGFDQEVAVARRVFFYMPFEHSEAALDQTRSVALIRTLGDDAFTRFAIEHKELIDRFGRYPHRNAILGRPSTPEELTFLASSDQSFGQTASDK